MIEPAARKARPAPRLDLTGTEYRLLLTTWLAAVYTACWLALQPPASSAPAPIGHMGATVRQPAAASRERPAPARSVRLRTRSS